MRQTRRQTKLKSTRFDELQKPINLGHRKVQKNRKSLSLILPKMWSTFNDVAAGDTVEVIMETNGTLSVRKGI